MRMKTLQTFSHGRGGGEEEEDGNFYIDEGTLSPIPNFTKSPLIITKKMMSKKNYKNNHHSSSALSSLSSGLSKSDQNPMTMMKMSRRSSNPAVSSHNLSSSLGSLMAALPLCPSPVCSSHSSPSSPTGTAAFCSPSSFLPCDFSRSSGDFYTPVHQNSSVYSNSSMKKQEQSPKCLSISTIYESAIDHNYNRIAPFDSHGSSLRNTINSPRSLHSSGPPPLQDYEPSISTSSAHGATSFPSLPSVPEDMAPAYSHRRRESGRPERLDRAEQLMTEEEVEHPTPVNRPKPYEEFLSEVQKHRKNAELSAMRNAVYTRLLDQLRRKEGAIDDWELSHRCKQELQLDKIERKLEKKRAIAVQKMHQKVAEINIEAERRRARERQSFLKKIDRLSGQIQNKAGSKMFLHTWSCCCCFNPGSDDIS